MAVSCSLMDLPARLSYNWALSSASTHYVYANGLIQVQADTATFWFSTYPLVYGRYLGTVWTSKHQTWKYETGHARALSSDFGAIYV